ncbi:ComF family protein [Gaiella sp.]|uniref:ComF family protein n=1 Tax=Gaiella sp. TaxID=2663207 RepID=UPI002E300A5C|nr:double zinc ribbon domain-containing protein [Gaiella sp.]HEX5582252.1 double zinc ribbon domain-containing protein [Gaiella sp.]
MGLLGLVLPSRCAVCGVPGSAVCPRCDEGLVRIGPPVCERCGCPGAWPVRRCVECAGRRLGFDRARSALVYEARARRLVSAWKERGRRDLAPTLAAIVADVLARPEVDALTFVPGDRERGRARGHVPSARLAEALAALWELPFEGLLTRTGAAPRQAALPRRARAANVREAFAPRDTAPRRVALVDDVYTTGATASACARRLRQAGARRVEVVCLARAVR